MIKRGPDCSSLIYSVIFIIWKALKEARDGSLGRGAPEVGEVLCAGILITVSTNSASSKPGQCILPDENMHQPA